MVDALFRSVSRFLKNILFLFFVQRASCPTFLNSCFFSVVQKLKLTVWTLERVDLLCVYHGSDPEDILMEDSCNKT